MFGDQVSVAAQAIAGPFYLHDDGVVQKPVQKGGCNDGVAKDLVCFL